MTSVQEEWRPVRGYEGLYEVSDAGRVRSLGRDLERVDGYRYVLPPKILSAWLTRGYPTVSLSKNGKVRKTTVHRLVAAAFLPPPAGDRWHVNHIDADPRNNCASNLEWVTHAENMAHAHTLGLRTAPRGVASGSAKLDDDAVRDIRSSYPAATVKALAAKYGVCGRVVYAVLNRKTWRHVR